MPYADYGGFDAAYFDAASAQTPHPAGYTEYRAGLLPFAHYADLMATAIEQYGVDASGAKVLVVGCAYGYTVQWLRDQYGVEAWGMDVSQHAVEQAGTEIADDVVRHGDVLSAQDIKAVRRDAPGGPFDIVFTECVLECLTDAEAQTATANCRDAAKHQSVHRVWTMDRVNPDYYNAKDLAGWRALCDADGADGWFGEADFQPY